MRLPTPAHSEARPASRATVSGPARPVRGRQTVTAHQWCALQLIPRRTRGGNDTASVPSSRLKVCGGAKVSCILALAKRVATAWQRTPAEQLVRGSWTDRHWRRCPSCAWDACGHLGTCTSDGRGARADRPFLPATRWVMSTPLSSRHFQSKPLRCQLGRLRSLAAPARQPPSSAKS